MDNDMNTERLVLRGARFNVNAMTLIGSDGQPYVREVIRHPGAVVILPIIDRDTIVMIENTRPSVAETLLELPAGTREPKEAAELTAARELAEETGYQAESLTLLHEFYSAPGICDEKMFLFVATGLTPGESQPEATECIENRIVTRDEVQKWIHQGTIRDAKTLVGLYAFLYDRRVAENVF